MSNKKGIPLSSEGLFQLNWIKYLRYHGLSDDQFTYDEHSVTVIDSDKERIQTRPTTYIPSTDVFGCYHIIFEAFDNHTDELTAQGSCGNMSTTIYDIGTHEWTFSDNGRGMPHGSVIDILTKINAGAKMNNSKHTAFQESGGTNGVGYKLIAFLTEYAKISTRRDGKETYVEFQNGEMVEHKCTATKQKSGTTDVFKFRKRFLPKFKEVDPEYVKNIIEQKSFIHPHIKFNLIILKNGVEKENYRFAGRDISDWIKLQKPDTSIMRFTGQATHPKNKKTGKIDVAFAYAENYVDKPDQEMQIMLSYANGIKTLYGGSHLTGLKNAIAKYFRKQLLEKVLSKKDREMTIYSSDITNGLVCFIDVRLNEPVFRGQYKDKLEVDWIQKIVEDFVYQGLVASKDKDISSIANFIKNVVKAKNDAKKIRTNVNVKNAFSKDRISTFFPHIESLKTINPELFLVEGKSANTNILPVIDKYNQAILQLTGKTNNFVDSKPSDIMNGKDNAIKDFYQIMGGYPGKPFDISKLPYKKIIFGTDGDTDGADMRNGVIANIAEHNPELIAAGIIYTTLVPLYSFYDERGKKQFLPTQKHLVNYIINRFMTFHQITEGRKILSKYDLFQLVYKNYSYSEKINTLATDRRIDPKILEKIIAVITDDNSTDVDFWTKWAAKNMDSTIRVIINEGKVIFSGIQGDSTLFFVINKHFMKKAKKLQKNIRECEDLFNFKIDDDKKTRSLYDIISLVKGYQPKGIDRYKGVGELESDELYHHCFNPKTRTLLQIVFSDNPSEDIEVCRLFKSGKKQYVEARSELLRTVDVSDIEIDT